MHYLRQPLNQVTAIRHLKYSTSRTDQLNLKEAASWNTTISQAERVVGYPTSFLNLRWLLSDEMANVAVYFRKLLGTNHPLLKVAKNLILSNEKPSWGLLVLLVSKAGGHNKAFSVVEKDLTAGILHSQRILGEVTEMIRTSNLLHKSLISIDGRTKNAINLKFGNKIALLCGDYLLSNSYHQLACIKNHTLNELMSSALRDLVENEFIGPRDRHNRPLPNKPKLEKNDVEILDEINMLPSDFENVLGNAKAEWIVRNTLGGASLLGKSCQGVLMLAGHEEKFQKDGYILGKYLALSLKATQDYNAIFNNKYISPISAPVLFYLQHYPNFYTEFEKSISSDGELHREKIIEKLRHSPALNDTKFLQNELCNRTLDALKKFNDCDAKTALKNIVFSIIL